MTERCRITNLGPYDTTGAKEAVEVLPFLANTTVHIIIDGTASVRLQASNQSAAEVERDGWQGANITALPTTNTQIRSLSGKPVQTLRLQINSIGPAGTVSARVVQAV